MDIAKITSDIRSRIRTEQKPKRFAHSVAVAEMTSGLCSLHGLDPASGYLAGIAHDMEKRRDFHDLHVFLAGRDYPGLGEFRQHPEALHGPAARYVLEERYAVRDPAILQAVETHCLPRSDMGPLALALWIADKAEPSRTHHDASLRESLETMTLVEGFLSVMESLIRDFGRKGRQVYPSTLFLYTTLKGRRQ